MKDSTGFHFSVTLVAASPLPKPSPSLEALSCSPGRAPGHRVDSSMLHHGMLVLPLQALLKESLEKAQEESERIEQVMQKLEEQTHSIKVMMQPPPCQACGWERAGSHGSSPPRTPLRGSNR